MQARKTFGKRNEPVSAFETGSGLPRLGAYALALVVILGIGVLAMQVLLAGDPSGHAGDLSPNFTEPVGEFSLVGLWANGGQTCDEDGTRFEFDGDTFWMVNSKLRVPIGPYKISGSSPLVFEQSGVKIPLAISNNGNSIEPLDHNDPKKTFHLTRC